MYLLTLLLAGASFYFVLRGGRALSPPGWGFHGDDAVLAVAFSTVGVLITANRPRNMIGWLMMVIALGSAVSSIVEEYFVVQRLEGGRFPESAPYFLWFGNWLWVTLAVPAWVFIPSIFPNGRLVSPRWRWVPVAGGLAMLALFGATALATPTVGEINTLPNPLWGAALAPLEGPLFGVGMVLMAAAAVGAAASAVVRYRQASTEVRLQLKWIMYAAVLLALTVPLAGLQNNALHMLVIAASILLGVAIGVAVLRYRLYEIDVLINRTLVYGPLTAIVAGLIAASSRVFSLVLTPLAGADSDWTAILTTLVAVAAVTPLRNRLQSFVDRRFKEIHDPSQILESLRTQVETGIWIIDRERSLARLLASAVDAFQARGGAVYLRTRSRRRLVERQGSWTGKPALSVSLTAGRENIGELQLASRVDGRPYAAGDRELLQRIGGEVARALRV
jgi:hypothetical protein